MRRHPTRWSEVAVSEVPVVYGYALDEMDATCGLVPTQYRRLMGKGWVVDELPEQGISCVVRSGDVWIEGPPEGFLEPKLARALCRVLADFTTESESCWFGIWEGFGFLSESQRAAPSISAPGRSWHLFRAPLHGIEQSFSPDFEHHSANLVWSDDRSWCVATAIDVEASYVGGSDELIAAVLDEPALEAERVLPTDGLASLHDVLRPVVELQEVVALPAGFESRKYPAELRESNPGVRLISWLLSWCMRRKDPFGLKGYRMPWR